MTGSERAAGAPLRLLSWPGMPAPEALERVAARIGVALHVETIVANEELERRLGEGWDLICPSDYMVQRLARQGRLRPLDDALLPGRRQLADWARRPAYDPGDRWSVPLAFGTVGVLYDRAALGAVPEPGGWSLLFDPPAGARVGMLAEPREVVSAALLAAGRDANAADDAALAAAAALLERQAPAVARFDSDDFTGPVRARQVSAHQAWSGPASVALRADPGLGYTVPREGAVAWVTTVAITAGCSRAALAHAAIEALLDPALARLNVERDGFATPNAAARALLQPALRDDPVLFPDAATLARCTTLRELDEAQERAVTALYERVAG
ncbi:spermidine/putrescine ABC transporter substrate-binding protein [Conexibacter stalactiti]|uniref:Spermidine/putrescine ABC transporter substrate-binding protein n=1 Tax=Conexibacter stalactiti TaxID=1940611 RepID=A0ABU4HT17_9ACTN|nr:spermidine/putrescine ABC transporter substrate-binding protein [Conexibacter stalactiti]MDW5595204.1 spermidine/putrescine ABC transporter substrate-binding protein [Conexibacter stalactiti]MEC5035846.1 spermidine/putrescine ABC transporter substrate-binding protein [Conexibacter stalactiti]